MPVWLQLIFLVAGILWIRSINKSSKQLEGNIRKGQQALGAQKRLQNFLDGKISYNQYVSVEKAHRHLDDELR